MNRKFRLNSNFDLVNRKSALVNPLGLTIHVLVAPSPLLPGYRSMSADFP
jgi:hypothetical protein